jgi:hypothetical protein
MVVLPSFLVTRSIPASDICSQRLEGAYFRGSEGAEALADDKDHFTVTQLETVDNTAETA